jgi:poly(ADP-ribose) glycohydrolase ARH3
VVGRHPQRDGHCCSESQGEVATPVAFMHLTVDQFAGCMLGLATGDALGAPYEGGLLERFVWRIIGRTSDGCLRWTDDTQMALDLAESLLEEDSVRPEALAKRFASSYRWSRGYGPGAARVLKRIRRGEPWETASRAVYAEGSYGNGAAMRAPVLALFFAGDHDALIAAARSSARVTHAHALGVEGAVLIALAAHASLERRPAAELLEYVRTECSTPEISERLKTVASWIETGDTPAPREVARKLGNGIAAPTSCPTALYIALRHSKTSFEAMMEFIVACRGDVDTIGAMAGALWGIVNGADRLPKVRLEARELLVDTATRLFERHH